MKHTTQIFILLTAILWTFTCNATDLLFPKEGGFNLKKDLLLLHYDCKTDVDDLHSIAAVATLMSNSKFAGIRHHAVAGTYGTQEGLYVPPNPLFQLAFRANWTDANENFQIAIEQVKAIAVETLINQGDVWIAEAGQSDFTAGLLKAIQSELPELNVSKRIHVVQHSDWNEEATSTDDLKFVKENANYHKVPDGNAVGNGTPGFRDPNYTYWKDKITNPKLIEIWQLATDLSNKYNGKEGRYNNKAISAGGLDFSDFSEVCWILGVKSIEDTKQFFNTYSN
jgi:hypothetical protein